MFDLKPLSKDAIPAALAKAERYRLLNESEMAQSICEDVLATEPENRQAVVTMRSRVPCGTSSLSTRLL